MSTPWPPSGDNGENPFASGTSTPEDREPQYTSPQTPQTSTFESPLLPPDAREPQSPIRPTSRSFSANNFVSSPLNPNSGMTNAIRSRPASRGSTYFNRIASEESQALASQFSTMTAGNRGSMVLYRLASDDDPLLPPKVLHNRDSVASSSGDSIFSLSSDSKYPSGVVAGPQRGFVPYAYDPDLDMKEGADDDDYLHKPDYGEDKRALWSWRGILNISVLVILILALLTLFICYPVVSFLANNARNLAIDGNIRINGTGQAPVLYVQHFCLPIVKVPHRLIVLLLAFNYHSLSTLIRLRMQRHGPGSMENRMSWFSQTNLISMGGHFTPAMIPSGKLKISGMGRQLIKSGMTRRRSLQKMANFVLSWNRLPISHRTTGFSTRVACSKAGTNSVSLVDTSKSLSLFLDRILILRDMSVVSNFM